MTNGASTTDRDARALQGVGLMAIAMLLIPSMDAVAKFLAESDPPMAPAQIAWFRFAVQTLILIPIIFALRGARVFLPHRPGLVALRGLLIALATLLFFTAVQFMPLAETTAIFFVEPLILTVLSAWLLRETIGWRRILAVGIGLAGAMLIVRPQFAEVGWPALLPLGVAVCFAFYMLLTKILADSEDPLTLHVWAGFVGTLALGAAQVLGPALGANAFAPRWPIGGVFETEWGLLLFLGLVATVAHFLVVLALQRAPASQLAPLQYLEIVASALLGWLIFQDFPDALTWLGIAAIVGSGVFVVHRERVRASDPN